MSSPDSCYHCGASFAYVVLPPGLNEQDTDKYCECKGRSTCVVLLPDGTECGMQGFKGPSARGWGMACRAHAVG